MKWKDGIVAVKPANLTFEQAAAVPVGGITIDICIDKSNWRIFFDYFIQISVE